MRASLLALSALAVLITSCAVERPSDRVETRCLFGDLMFETRDGGIGFVEDSPQCAEREVAAKSSMEKEDLEPNQRAIQSADVGVDADREPDSLPAADVSQSAACGDLVGPDRTGCWEAELDVQDQRLNFEYNSLRARLGERDQAQLRDMQRRWIDHRDSVCADDQGGSGSWVQTSCLALETAERRRFLQAYNPE